jgi:urease accessory protein
VRRASGRRRSAPAPLLALALLLAPAPVWAHGTVPIGDFYGGILEPVYHLESLLLLLAVALAATQLQGLDRGRFPLAFAAGSLAGALAGLGAVPLPGAAWAVRGGTLALGLAVAARRVPPGVAGLVVAVGLGAAQGHFGSFGDRAALSRPTLYALGLSLAPLLASGSALALADRFRAFWLEVAVRIAGSWIATVAILVAALELANLQK